MSLIGKVTPNSRGGGENRMGLKNNVQNKSVIKLEFKPSLWNK